MNKKILMVSGARSEFELKKTYLNYSARKKVWNLCW